MSDKKDPRAAARLRGKRFALGVYGTFASAFVALCTWQLVSGVFNVGAAPLTVHGSLPSDACSQDLRALRAALDRALAASVTASDDATALATYRRALSPEWDGEKTAADRCAKEPLGTEAYAALLRLRLAQEAQLRRQIVEMGPIRRDLAAYLP
jgi:hypothetical protein